MWAVLQFLPPFGVQKTLTQECCQIGTVQGLIAHPLPVFCAAGQEQSREEMGRVNKACSPNLTEFLYRKVLL